MSEFDTTGKEGARVRLEPLVARFGELSYLPYATWPDLGYLLELERAVRDEVDGMVVQMREQGSTFANIARFAEPEESEDSESWQAWRQRYGRGVKRLRGEDEEILPLKELRARRQELERLEKLLKVGPRPLVERSADNQVELQIFAVDVRRGDCIDGHPTRIVARVEEDPYTGLAPYVAVTFHDGSSYPFALDYKFTFGHESALDAD